MKIKFYLITTLVFAVGFSFILPTYAQLQNIEDVNLKVNSITKIDSEKTNILILSVSFINEGNSASQILTNSIFLVDSKQREFSSASYLELKEKNHNISSIDCPFTFTVSVNPGITQNANLFYEIPKDVDLKYSLKLYESSPEICAEPIFDCTIKNFPIAANDSNSQSAISPKIPDWIKNTALWYGQGKISEDEFLNAIKYLINQGIIKVK